MRFLLNEGAEVPLRDLPDNLQKSLTEQMGAMRYVDRATLADVVTEFASELEAMGLTFPRGVPGALSALDGQISPQTAARLRKEAGVRQFGDPWAQVRAADADMLLNILKAECAEIAAVMLSKLDVPRAADLLGKLPGETARRITYAISQTASVTPATVDRIGLSLASQLHDLPETAFANDPAKRLGAILNSSPSITRDDLLSGLDEDDQSFAALVRKTIFTFAHIAGRVRPQDIPIIVRELDQPVLITALAAATDDANGPSATYILDNMSKRMAESLRDEISELGEVAANDAEEAMIAVTNAIQRLEAEGGIELLPLQDNET